MIIFAMAFLILFDPMAHDDLLDSLAYIDQIASTNYTPFIEVDEFEPLDSWIGI